MAASVSSNPGPPSPGRTGRWRRPLLVLGGLLAAGLLAWAGNTAFHRFWPFQRYRDELARVGPPLPGTTLVSETTSGFPYGCLDQCPAVTAEWHLSRPLPQGVARESLASRLAARGYVMQAPPLICRGGQCSYLFHAGGFDYGVRLELGYPPSVPPGPAGAGADGSAPVVGIETWVMPG